MDGRATANDRWTAWSISSRSSCRRIGSREHTFQRLSQRQKAFSDAHQVWTFGKHAVAGQKLEEARCEGNAEGDVLAQGKSEHTPHQAKHFAACLGEWVSKQHHEREVGAALKQGVLLAHPGLAFLGLNCAPASVDLQQPAVLAVVAHAAGYKAVVLAKDLRCDQGEGGPVHGITGFKVASLLR
jgi:hypothetical protein